MPGVCSSICTYAASGAAMSTRASSLPSSRPITASWSVSIERCSSSRSIWFAPSRRIIRPGVPLPRADGLARAALHEGDVEFLLAVAQEHQVLARADRLAQLDADAIALELLDVALAELGIGAVLGTGAEDHMLGRHRIEQEVRQDQEPDADDEERPPRDQEIAHRDQRLADDARHQAATFC